MWIKGLSYSINFDQATYVKLFKERRFDEEGKEYYSYYISFWRVMEDSRHNSSGTELMCVGYTSEDEQKKAYELIFSSLSQGKAYVDIGGVKCQ